MIPKTHTQAFALLMEEVGAAFSAYGHRLHGLDPETESHAEHLAAMDQWQRTDATGVKVADDGSVKRETVEPKKTGVVAARELRLQLLKDSGRQILSTEQRAQVFETLGDFTRAELANVMACSLEAASKQIQGWAEPTGEKRKGRYDQLKSNVYRAKAAPAPKPRSAPSPVGEVTTKLRNHLLARSSKEFMASTIAEEMGADKKTISDRIRVMPEIEEIGTVPTGARPAKLYRFNPHVNQPKAEAPKDNGRPEKEMHPLRKLGAKKPNVGNKDLQKIIDQAWDQGWLPVKTASGHMRWEGPDGQTKFHGSTTPSDHLGLNNVKKDLRRHGATIT